MTGPRVGLVLVDHGSRLEEANRLLETVAARARTLAPEYAAVEPAHMELATPDLAEAFARCVAAGAESVVVVPYFLAPGRHASEDIPRMAAEAAARHPGVSWSVAPPLGLDDRLVEAALARARDAADRA